MSLQVWLPLKGNLENLGLAGDVEFKNVDDDNIWGIMTDGKIGSSWTFDESHLRYVGSPVSSDEMSVAFWVYVLSWSTNYDTFFQLGVGTAPWASYTFGILRSTGTNICAVVSDGTNSTASSCSTAFDIVGAWHHIAATFKPGTLSLYIDGVLKKEITTTIEPDFGSASYCTIGRTNDKSYPCDCALNDFRIYDHCLSAKEVKLISQALVCHYPLNDFISSEYTSKFNVLDTDSMTYDSSSYLSYQIPINQYSCNVNNVTYQIELTDINVTNTGKSASELGLSVGLYSSSAGYSTELKRFIGTEFFTNGHADKLVLMFNRQLGIEEGHATLSNYAIFIYNSPRAGSGPEPDGTKSMSIGSIKMYEVPFEMGGTVYDVSGYGNHGTMASSGVSAGEGSIRYLSCVQFDKGSSTSGYIDAGTGGKVTDEITVSTWMYMDTWTTNQHPFSCTEGGGWNIETNSSMPTFPVYVSTVGYKHSVKSGVTPKWTDLSSGWHLFTGTYDGYTVTLYIDGQPAGSTGTGKTDKLPIQYHASNHIYLHSEATGSGPSGSYDACKMSDFRIYATALSADDVKELYETSASVDNHGNMYAYEFNEL